jgi:hypothetical protein
MIESQIYKYCDHRTWALERKAYWSYVQRVWNMLRVYLARAEHDRASGVQITLAAVWVLGSEAS